MMRRCRKCKGTYHEVFFKQSNRKLRTRVGVKIYRSAICLGCEQDGRDNKKKQNRPRKKAQDAIRTHSEKMVQKSIIENRDDLTNIYGWDMNRMTHDIAHAYENTCGYCYRPYSEMGHGLADVTLDIIDPTKPPHYRTNTTWCCATCNKEKQATPPDLWDMKCESWRKWERQQELMKIDPWFGLPLFEGKITETGQMSMF